MYSFTGPAEVKGKYQKIRDWFQPILIFIFVATPWLKINEQPVLLLDFFNRHFVILGFSFYSHDTPLLFFLAIILILIIFSVTAVFGRLWCGWSCPQTVFLHSVFNKIEKFIMGTYAKRTSYYRSEVDTKKIFKISILYAVFLLICWVLAHSFVAYFVGAGVVTKYISDGINQHPQAFSILISMTLALFFNFTFFREKLCLYICPYGRFQNALIDGNTLVVFYNNLRGEPRKKTKFKIEDSGDCVNCNRCVTVCPVNIDIRQGFQQECIACAKCIDACDEVMTKLNRQRQLIRYETGDLQKITFKRFRLLLYGGLLLIFTAAFVWSITGRSELDLNIGRSAFRPFTVRNSENKKIIQNQLQLHIKNQAHRNFILSIELSEKNKKQGFKLFSAVTNLSIMAEQDLKMPAFIEINESDLKLADKKIEIIFKYEKTQNIRFINFVVVH